MKEMQWLTVSQVAETMRVSEETVRRWLRSGRLRGHNFSGRTGYRIETTAFEDFLRREMGGKENAAQDEPERRGTRSPVTADEGS